jgi:hypothetical protein
MQVLAGLLNLRKMLLERTKFAIIAIINWKNASLNQNAHSWGSGEELRALGQKVDIVSNAINRVKIPAASQNSLSLINQRRLLFRGMA